MNIFDTEDQPVDFNSTVTKKDSPVEEVNNLQATSLAITHAANSGEAYSTDGQQALKDQLQYMGLANTAKPVINEHNAEMFTQYTDALNRLNGSTDNDQERQDNNASFLDVIRNLPTFDNHSDIIKATLESIGAPDNDITRNIVVNQTAQKMSAEMGKADGIWNTALAIGESIFPEFQILDRYLVGKQLPEVKGLNLNAAVKAYSLASPEDKLKMLPDIQKLVTDNVPNAWSRQAIFNTITGLNDTSFDKQMLEDVGFSALDFPVLTGAKALYRATKGVSALKVTKDAGEIGNKIAGALNAAALEDVKSGAAAGADMATAQGNISGFNLEQLFPNHTDGIAHSSMLAIDQKVQNVDAELNKLIIKNHNLYTDADRSAAKDKWFDDFYQKYVDAGTEGVSPEKLSAENVTFNDTLNGFDVTVRTKAATYRIPVKITNADVGAFETSELNLAQSMLSKFASPNATIRTIQENYVSQATILDRQVAANIRAMTQAGVNATKGVSAKRLAVVDEVLLHGDNPGAIDGRVFTPNQLMVEGLDIPGVGTVKLNEAEAGSYYGLRRVFDQLHELENYRVRRGLQFDGYKGLDFAVDDAVADTFHTYAKPVERFEVGTDRVYNASTKSIVAPTDEAVVKGLESGSLQRVTFKNPVKIVRGANDVEWIDSGIVEVSHLKELPRYVLNKRTGYVPLVRKNANFFARRTVSGTVSGRPLKVVKTDRIFNTRRDAEAWINLPENQGKDYFVAEDRQRVVDQGFRDEVEYTRMGGLYGSSRVQRQMLYGLDGTEPVRISAIEAMKRNLAHAASTVTFNEFRISALSKFNKTYGPEGLNILKEPGDPLNSALKNGTSFKLKAAVTKQQQFLNHALRIPSPEESAWSAFWKHTAGWMEGSDILKDSKLRDQVLDLRSRNPVSAIKGAAFHDLLGVWNPSQLIVQSFGAIPAVSVSAERFPIVMARYQALRALMYLRKVDNIGAVELGAEKIAAAIRPFTGLSKEETVKLVDHFHESGILDSVRTNGDYEAALSSFNVDHGLIHKFFDSGLYFYREGELFNRSYAWLAAHDEYLRKTGKSITKLDDFDLEKIAKRGQALGINMDRVNAAQWQRGWTGVPTQFLQVNAKVIEAMIGKELSTSDKLRMLVGTTLVGGAAAIPGGTWMLTKLAENSGVQYGQLDDKTRAGLEGGAADLLAYWLAGTRVDVSTRTSMLNGIEQSWDQLNSGDLTLLDAAMGATSSVSNRIIKAWRDSGAILAPVYDDFSSFDPSMVMDVTNQWFKLASSYNNATQGYLAWKLGHITDSRGNLLIQLDEDDPLRIPMSMIRGAGFTSSRESFIWQGLKDTQALQADEKKIADNLVFLFRNYEGRFNDQEQFDRYRVASTLALRPFDDNPVAQDRIMKAVEGRLNNPREHEIFKTIVNRALEGTDTTSSLFAPQTVEPLEEFKVQPGTALDAVINKGNK